MFKHVLIPTDGSKHSRRAIERAVELAQAISARVTGIALSAPYHFFSSDLPLATNIRDVYEAKCEWEAKKRLRVIRKAAAEAGVEYAGVHAYSARPYESMIQTADERGCDLICMASHGRRGVTALLRGGETAKVLAHSRIPVLVFR